jgi:hypothetical protein
MGCECIYVQCISCMRITEESMSQAGIKQWIMHADYRRKVLSTLHSVLSYAQYRVLQSV